ncbi:MAG: hypothetical protein H6Q75_797 [Firmicutes bacterium]|nr:hypothetical protein [Bacillota bacterium]
MLLAVEYLGEVGVGVTAPHFFRADNGHIYVVKLKNNRLGPTVLVSEYVAARLGHILGLCFPPSDLIHLSSEFILQTPLFSSGVDPGLHFASRYLTPTQHLTKETLSLASNVNEMAGVLLFDHMFHNLDHISNKRNLLLHREETGFKIYSIDNSHLFKGGRWTVAKLDKLARKTKIYTQGLFRVLLNDFLAVQDFLPYLDNANNLTDPLITELVQDIPAEWLTEEDERAALIRHIQARRDIAGQLFHKLLKHIPTSRGGTKTFTPRVIRHTLKTK